MLIFQRNLVNCERFWPPEFSTMSASGALGRSLLKTSQPLYRVLEQKTQAMYVGTYMKISNGFKDRFANFSLKCHSTEKKILLASCLCIWRFQHQRSPLILCSPLINFGCVLCSCCTFLKNTSAKNLLLKYKDKRSHLVNFSIQQKLEY